VAGTDRRCGVALVLVCCVALVTAGCAAARPPARAAAVASPSGLVAAGRYLAIAEDGNDRLEVDFDRLAGRDRGRLAAAHADLRDAAATERRFAGACWRSCSRRRPSRSYGCCSRSISPGRA